MIKSFFILSRLWRYLNLYFLKPFDAVNDTLTASLLARLDWSGKIVEIGSGDGVYSYVMHGGNFPIWFDRYLLTDLNKIDIYSSHKKNIIQVSKKITEPDFILSIDAKDFHIEKVKEIGFAKKALVMPYENIELSDNSVEKIFYYTPHGLKDHQKALKETLRILKNDGTMLILLYHTDVKPSFLAKRISSKFKNTRIGSYFNKIDNGRFDEITNMSKSTAEWEDYFKKIGFKIKKIIFGLSPFAWKVYDIQTRPILKYLIRFFNFFPLPIRTTFKLLWIFIWYPFLVLFYILFSNDMIKLHKKNCYIAFELTK